jgi:hypothetical protein
MLSTTAIDSCCCCCHALLLQAKLTLLLTWGSSGQLELWCHAEPLLPRPKPPVKLLIK